MAKSLYICYFGLREPLVQTQVLPYLRELQKDGHEISLLTFEPEVKRKWTTADLAAERAKLAEENIYWEWLPYHKRFSAGATSYDILNGARAVERLIDQRQIDILHCRVHIPAAMAALARKFTTRKPKLLFDIRGFFPEEYTDAGLWKENGSIYKTVKRIERWLMREADGFVVLTEKAREILFPESSSTGADKFGRPVEVIPCCVDFNGRFVNDAEERRHLMRKAMALEDRYVITHIGALGGLYLTEELTKLFARARQRSKNAFALILTQSDASEITSLLQKAGYGTNDYLVDRVSPKEVPDFLASADLALSFVRASYSTQSRSPTKIPEYLAAGVPVLANRGVGDVDVILEGSSVGVLVQDFDCDSLDSALEELENMADVRSRCQQTARSLFDLGNVGGARYRDLYRRILSPHDQ